jgi:nuclear transport factor 2 (NTF2) superfamily protein
MLQLNTDFGRKGGEAWQDDDDGKLDTNIASIAAAIIVASEAKFRKGLAKQKSALSNSDWNRRSGGRSSLLNSTVSA